MTSGPVVVVGAGPTGVTTALALAAHGVPTVVLERRVEVHPLPRAVHLDDEAVRVLQSIGVGPAFTAISRPGRGLRLLDAQLRTMAEFTRGAGRYGHPQANLFDQPDLERVLRTELARRPEAGLRTGVEVLGVEPVDGGAVVRLQDLTTGHVEHLRTPAVLGCDGAASLVRDVVGARWQDLRSTERWLVVDVRCPVPLGHWEGVHQVCSPVRAATFLRVGVDRYRWEFQLHDGERADDLVRPEVLQALVGPWTGGLAPDRLEVLRSSEYVFRARLADRWRRGRVLLVGDAAHQTPPFVGQGLGAGVRDAGNLAWKLAAVLRGEAPEELLDSYERERRPHVRTLIRLARTAGWAMTGGGGRGAAARRAGLAGLCRLPGASRLLDRGTPPLVGGPLVPRRDPLAGTLSPQPTVDDGRLLDDVLGPGAVVLTTAAVDPQLLAVADMLRARLVRVDGRRLIADDGLVVADDGTISRWLRAARVRTVVVRPDRVVLLSDRSDLRPGASIAGRHGAVLRLVGAQPVSLPAGAPRGAGPRRR